MKLTQFQAHILKILDGEGGHDVSAQSLCRQMTQKSIAEAHPALLAAMARDVRLLREAGLLDRHRTGAGSEQSVAITLRGSSALQLDARRHRRSRQLRRAAIAVGAAAIVVCIVTIIAAS